MAKYSFEFKKKVVQEYLDGKGSRGFLNTVKENILDYMPDDYANAEIRIDGVMKNNGIIKQGIKIYNVYYKNFN